MTRMELYINRRCSGAFPAESSDGYAVQSREDLLGELYCVTDLTQEDVAKMSTEQVTAVIDNHFSVNRATDSGSIASYDIYRPWPAAPEMLVFVGEPGDIIDDAVERLTDDSSDATRIDSECAVSAIENYINSRPTK